MKPIFVALVILSTIGLSLAHTSALHNPEYRDMLKAGILDDMSLFRRKRGFDSYTEYNNDVSDWSNMVGNGQYLDADFVRKFRNNPRLAYLFNL